MKNYFSRTAGAMRWTLLGLGSLMMSVHASVAAPSLRDVLTAEDFVRAGLEKLTTAELEFLSERLLTAPLPGPAGTLDAAPRAGGADSRSSGRRSAVQTGEAAFGQEDRLRIETERAQQVPKQMQGRIQGTFKGWSGRTVFPLEGGQVWQQVEPGTFSVHLDAPAVTIRKGLLGVFYLQVAGYGSQVKIKRIK